MEADISGRRRSLLFLLSVCLLLFFMNLGVPGLWDEDEPRNATCAREMLARGDWIVPTFNGELRTAKPVLLYWLIMMAYSVMGISEFSARFWPALLGTGTVLLTWRLGLRFYGNRVGLWSGLLLACSLMFVVASRACTPDAPLIFFVTAAMSLVGSTWARSTVPSQFRTTSSTLGQPKSLPLSVAVCFYLALGLGVLAKGPVGVVLPIAMIGSYLLISGCFNSELHSLSVLSRLRRTCGSLHWYLDQLQIVRWQVGLPLLLVLVIPWYLAVAVQTDGAWLKQFLGAENVGRFMKPMEGHRGPIIYYFVTVLIGFYPASVFLPFSIVLLFKRLRTNPHSTDLFLACWSFVWIGFFSLAGTKLPSYVTPAFPPLAILTARGLVGWLERPDSMPRWLTRTAFLVPALVGLGFCTAIPVVAHRYLENDLRPLWVGAIPLVAGLLASWSFQRRNSLAAARWFMAGGIGFSTALFGLVSVQVDRHQSSEPIFSEMKTKYPDLTEIGTFRFSPPSFVFYAGQTIHQLRSSDQVSDFFHKNVGHAFLILRESDLLELEPALPPEYSVLARRRRFLKDEEILVIGPARQAVALDE